MGLILDGVSARDLILDGQSVSLYVGGTPPVKVWPTTRSVTIQFMAGMYSGGFIKGDKSLVASTSNDGVIFVVDVIADRTVWRGGMADGTFIPAGVKAASLEFFSEEIITFTEVEVVQITLGTDLEARDQLRAALTERGLDHTTVTEIPFGIELVGTGSARDMFRACAALTTVPAMDTSGVTNMRSMFNGCAALTTVPAMDTSQVTEMGWMFQDCSALTSVPDMNTSNVTNMTSMFRACSSLTDGNVRLFGKHPSVTTTDMITGSGLTREPFRETVQLTLDAGWNAQMGFRDALSARGLNYRTVTEIPFEIELVGSGTTQNMFDGCKVLTSVPAMDTSRVTGMQYMFNGCSALTTVPKMDTSQVTDMSNMFNGCSALTSVPTMNTSQLTIAARVFYGCSALTDENVRFIGKNPNVDTMDMIRSSGLTREPFYATDRLPNPPDPRVVTIKRSSTYGQWDKNGVTGDVSLIQGWVGSENVRFAAYVTCNNSVESSDSYNLQKTGAVLRSGANIKPWTTNGIYTFTEVI